MEVATGPAVRLAPQLDVRHRVAMLLPDILRHYLAQMQAYKVLLESELFSCTPVRLETPVQQLISKAGVWVCCDHCGEEIINEREVCQNGKVLCRACAQGAYDYPDITPATCRLWRGA